MGLSRSTYYDEPCGQPIEDARFVERIKEICAEWPSYGYRSNPQPDPVHSRGCTPYRGSMLHAAGHKQARRRL